MAAWVMILQLRRKSKYEKMKGDWANVLNDE
jgi:hypothetical protein